MILKENTLQRTALTDFIRRNGPFAYFITLTFPRLQTIDTCTEQINYLIFMLNKKLFGRYNDYEYLQGYCIFENHGMSASNPFHSHIIIKNDSRLDPVSKKPFIDHFWSLLTKVRVVKAKQVTETMAFNKNCCDIRPADDQDGLINYVTKSFEYRIDYNNFRPIDKNGI